jgi:hypothetical protein
VAITQNLSPEHDHGEMPPGFALGVEAVLLGLALVAAGCAWVMLRGVAVDICGVSRASVTRERRCICRAALSCGCVMQTAPVR